MGDRSGEQTGVGPRKDLRRPLWLGEAPIAGKTILLHAEQGLGDTIMFARYAPLLARTGAKVVLEVQPELKALLAGLEGVAAIVAHGEPLPPFDVHCPLTSLPFACKTELSSVPADIPYLRASETQLAKWQPRLAGALPRPIAFRISAPQTEFLVQRFRRIPVAGASMRR